MELVGVNLYGNLGKLLTSDTELMKFYRSMRRKTTEEHAVFTYFDFRGVKVADNSLVRKFVLFGVDLDNLTSGSGFGSAFMRQDPTDQQGSG